MEDKELILGYIDDLIGSFVYYDRKEDEELTIERLNKAVQTGIVTIDEMSERFRKGLNSIQSWKNGDYE